MDELMQWSKWWKVTLAYKMSFKTDAATVNQFAALFLIVCILVTVGNIPYEATEEQLKDIFSEVGLVVSFRYAQ